MPLDVRTWRQWLSDLLTRGRLSGGGPLGTLGPDPDDPAPDDPAHGAPLDPATAVDPAARAV